MELRAKQLKQMGSEEREKALDQLRESLLHERATVALGGQPSNPGKIKSIRRQIARIKTVMGSEDQKE
ncbi:50S ribosomal protein L29 [uncultured archaeon]|nr:50S ribosomal protein L29 [uncultured archaeon]